MSTNNHEPSEEHTPHQVNSVSLANGEMADLSESEIAKQLEKHTQHDPWIGQQIGNLVVEQRIGKGGFGAVYRAKHEILGESFAVKVMHLNTEIPELIKRFQREAQTLKRLRHEKVVQLTDFGLIPDRGFYLVMEYLEGKSLLDCLRKRERFSVHRTKFLMMQLCEVLGYIHEKGIIHRDLKPGNVFLVQDDEGREQVRLIDFGIASLQDDLEGLTQTGSYLGTAKYASPEQVRGAKEIDGRSDLYSLTVIFFAMLTRRPPFRGKTDMDTAYQQIHMNPPSLSEVAPYKQWSPILESFLRRALSKEPNKRPRNAFEFWEGCSQALDAQYQIEADQSESNSMPWEEAADSSSSGLPSGIMIFDSSSQQRSVSTPPPTSHPFVRASQPDPSIPLSLAESSDSSPTLLPPGTQMEPETSSRPTGIIALISLVGLVAIGWFVYPMMFSPDTKHTPSTKQHTPPTKNPGNKKQTPLAITKRTIPDQTPTPAPKQAQQRPRPTLRKQHAPTKRRPAKKRIQRRIKRRRLPIRKRPKRTRRRRIVSKGPCGRLSSSHVWVFATSATPGIKLKAMSCSGCRIQRKSGGWCIGWPKGQSKLSVQATKDGFHPCIATIRQQNRRVRWTLKAENPMEMAPSLRYSCLK